MYMFRYEYTIKNITVFGVRSELVVFADFLFEIIVIVFDSNRESSALPQSRALVFEFSDTEDDCDEKCAYAQKNQGEHGYHDLLLLKTFRWFRVLIGGSSLSLRG